MSWFDNIVANGQIDTGSKLLVPMVMHALVVRKGQTGNWKNVTPDYSRVNRILYHGLGEYMEKEICGPIIPLTHQPGTHLHWTLPKAFRHGVQNNDSPAPEFPAVPNRWLITRTCVKDDKIYNKHWLIESDYCGVPAGQDMPNYLVIDQKDSESPLSESDSLRPIKLGRLCDPATWDETKQNRIRLTILAPGDPGFAASYFSCNGVFGFYDDLTTACPEADHCSYTVAGWYADANDDILYATKPEGWLRAMQDNGWKLSNLNTTGPILLPAGVLCHSMVYNVPCGKAPTESLDNAPGMNHVNVSMGNSSTEALAPLLIKNIEATSLKKAFDPLLAVYQHKLLSENGYNKGLSALRQGVHNQQFHSVEGGTLWVIDNKEEKPENNAADSTSDKTPQFLPFPPEISKLLVTLNDLQTEADRNIDTLLSVQEQSFFSWYLATWLRTKAAGKNQDRYKNELKDAVAKAGEEIENLLTAFQKNLTLADLDPAKTFSENYEFFYKKKITAKKNEIKSALSKYPQYELKESKMPAYQLPNELAIVIDGLKPAVDLNPGEEILCRLTSQAITGITYNGTEGKINVPAIPYDSFKSVTDANYLGTPFLNNDNIPKDAMLMLREALLIDPAANHVKATIASINKGDITSDDNTRNIERNIASQLTGLDKKVFGDALPPDPLSCKTWSQPWNPLYMEWEMEWVPAYKSLATDQIFGNWKYDANRTDYNNSGTPTLPLSNFRSRIFLSTDLSRKVKKIFDNTPSLSGVSYDGFQPVSQLLSGLNSNMVTLESGFQLPPLEIKDGKASINTIIKDISDEYLWRPAPGTTNGFFPVISGYFSLKNLYIIDSFGRLLDIIKDNVAKGQTYYSSNLQQVKVAGKTYIANPPRLANPVRLRFNWMSADNTRKTDSDPATSPICGWLLPNDLNSKSLMVFDAEGNELCYLVADKVKNIVRMSRPPGVADGGGIIGPGVNETLKQVITSILGVNFNSFSELYEAIDNKSKDGKAKSHFRHLAMELPIGYPIAIANASFCLEMKGLPPRDWNMFSENTLLSKVSIPVFVGNEPGSGDDYSDKTDGLIGFYSNGDFSKLNMPFGYPDKGGHAYLNTGYNPGVNIGSDGLPHVTQQVTLLLDPRLNFSLSAGILPSAQYELPAYGIGKAMEKIKLSFLVNPVLVKRKKTELPLREIKDKQWNWITNSAKPAEEIISAPSDNILTYEPLELVEGWLKLTDKNKDSK